MEDPLTDPTWNKDNPRWLRATVWAAQFAAWGWQQAGYPASDSPQGYRRCAACATEVPESRGQTRCSKCKMVPSTASVHPAVAGRKSASLSHYHSAGIFAASINQHLNTKIYSEFSSDRLFESSANESATEIDGEPTPPPSVLRLFEFFEAGEEPGPNTPTSTQYAAGFAAYFLAACAGDIGDEEMAWEHLEKGVSIAQRLRHHQLGSDCMKDQVNMLKTYKPSDTDQLQLQICDRVIRDAERHEDIYLMACANWSRAVLTMQQGLPGAEAYVQASKACWQDMMRASRLREEAGEPAMMLACGRLVELVLDYAKELMSTKKGDYAGAESAIREADEYCELAGLDETKLLILMARANLYELQATAASPDLLDKAADARQQLFVEMIEEGVEVCSQCSVCHQTLSAHQASDATKGPDGKILVNSCWHLFHQGCLKGRGEFDNCPDCHKPLWLSARTLA